MEQRKVPARIISGVTGHRPAQAGLWVMLNLLDIGLSSIAIRGGAFEINVVAHVLGLSYSGFFVYKLVTAVIVVVILARASKIHLLRWLNIGMVSVCTWNVLATVLVILSV